MLKKMKRLICLLTVLCLVASMTGFTAFAEDTVISEVTFEGTLPEINVGDPLPAADENGIKQVTGISCPELEADYILTAYWLKSYSSSVPDTEFEKAKYQLYINLYPKAGNESTVTFAEDVVIHGFGDRDWSASCSNQLAVFVEYDLRDKIEQIEVNGVPETIANGDSTALNITIPDDAFYTLEKTILKLPRNGGEQTEYTANTFTPGNYRIKITLNPKEGSYVEDAVNTALINGESLGGGDYLGSAYVEYIGISYADGSDVPGRYIELYYSIPYEAVTEISISGVPESITEGDSTALEITLPENAPYTANAYWTKFGGQPVGETFVADQYTLHVDLTPKEGYSFTSDVRYNLAVNGVMADPWSNFNYYGEDSVVFCYEYDLRAEIPAVEVSGIPTAEVGKTADVSGIKIPENANYTVEAYWVDPEIGDRFTGTFENKEYELYVSFLPKTGYCFAQSVQLTADGKTVERYDYSSYADGLDWGVWADLREQVVQVEVNNFPASLTVGEKLPTPEVKIPENAPYKIVNQQWSRGHGDDLEAVEKDIYTLRIELEMLESATIDEYGVSVKAEGEILREYSGENGWSYNYYRYNNIVIVSREYEMRDAIDTVQVVGVPEVAEGKSMDTSGLKIPEDANYEMVAWFSYDGPNAEETFQAGKEYALCAELSAKEGYYFSGDLLATVDGDFWDSIDIYNEFVMLIKVYQVPGEAVNTGLITKVELTGVPAVELGKGIDTSTVKVPENANYTLWQVDAFNADNGAPVETVEDGYEYVVRFELEPKGEYKFADKVDVYINGELQETVEYYMPYWLVFTNRANFKKDIGDIKLVGATDAKIGASAVTAGVTAEDAAKAEVTKVEWKKWDYDRACYIDFEGTFEAGSVYCRVIHFEIPERYELDGLVYVNGVEAERVYGEDPYCYCVETEFSLENKVISEIDLVITPPEIGKPFNTKNIQVSNDVPCYIQWKYWYNYDGDTYYDSVFVGDTHYSADLSLSPEAGYVFADNVKVTVNGKNADVTVAGITYLTLDLYSHFNTTVREDGSVAVRDGKLSELLYQAGEEAAGVVLDVSGMAQSSIKVDFPAAELGILAQENVALTIITDTATITLDAKTAETIAKAAGDESVVTLEVKYIEQTVLTAEQQTALKDKKVAGVISAQLLVDGKPLTDFGGGNVTIQIPYTITEGTVASGYTLWYLADDGSFTEQKATFADNKITTVMAHFSEYVVLYTPPAANPATGDAFPVTAFAAIMIMSVLGVAVVVVSKKRSVR